MHPQDIAIGGLLFVMGAVFFARMRQRKEPAKWKFVMAYVVMLCGALTATWTLFVPSH